MTKHFDSAIKAVKNGLDAPLGRALSMEPRIVVHSDDTGRTLLHWAAHYGRTHMARTLLAIPRGAEALGVCGGKHSEPPIHTAARAGKLAMIALLLERGADIEARDGEEQTALIAALGAEQYGSTCLLLCKGADIEAGGASSDGSPTPLEIRLAQRPGERSFVWLLLRFGATSTSRALTLALSAVMEGRADPALLDSLAEAGGCLLGPTSSVTGGFERTVDWVKSEQRSAGRRGWLGWMREEWDELMFRLTTPGPSTPQTKELWKARARMRREIEAQREVRFEAHLPRHRSDTCGCLV
eukprot:SAG11_NODE_681_length_7772_cov_26.403362_3_plen_298_part_00